MEVLIYAGVGGAVFLIMYAVIDMYADFRQGGPRIDPRAAELRFLPFRYTLPMGRWFGTPLGRLAADIELKRGREADSSLFIAVRRRLARMIVAAGNPGSMSPDEFMGLMFLWCLGGLACGVACYLYVGTLQPQDLPQLIFVILDKTSFGLIWIFPILGFLLPLVWLRDTLVNRHHQMRKKLPYSLDLLTLGVEAGLDFTSALGRIVQKLGDNPLAEEYDIMLKEILMGKNRAEALRDMGDRNNLLDLTSVVSALVQADELGAPLGPVLRIQAAQMRVRRSQRAEEQAMKAPVKILFPLVVCIFPATFIIILGPVAIRYWGTFFQ
jgi:tight adherence protein C